MAREAVAVMEPQVIEEEEYEQILQRVAAVDVAKASAMACARVPDQRRPGRRHTRVWQVNATPVLPVDGSMRSPASAAAPPRC
jgi:hypothetical protein